MFIKPFNLHSTSFGSLRKLPLTCWAIGLNCQYFHTSNRQLHFIAKYFLTWVCFPLFCSGCWLEIVFYFWHRIAFFCFDAGCIACSSIKVIRIARIAARQQINSIIFRTCTIVFAGWFLCCVTLFSSRKCWMLSAWSKKVTGCTLTSINVGIALLFIRKWMANLPF